MRKNISDLGKILRNSNTATITLSTGKKIAFKRKKKEMCPCLDYKLSAEERMEVAVAKMLLG